eukprot:symbB.v1.2.018121.t3/scaffold1433.1/size119041/1
MAFCGACCAWNGSVDVPVPEDLVDDMPILPVLDIAASSEDHVVSGVGLEKVSTLFRKFDRKGTGMVTADDLFITLQELPVPVRVNEGNVAMLLKSADKDEDGCLNFREFCDWLCECHVEEKWEELAKRNFALEIMLLLFSRAEQCTVQLHSSALGMVPDLPVPDTSQAADLVELIEATEASSDPIQQALKFREIVAFAKRTTGDCLGLIDSVARYREKLWKATEEHRGCFGLSTDALETEATGEVLGLHSKIHFILEGAINLVNIQRKALYTLHGINYLFKKLTSCSLRFVDALQRSKNVAKVVKDFVGTTEACEKLALFEELDRYHQAAHSLEELLKKAEAGKTEGLAPLPLNAFQGFKGPWKELKGQYAKTHRLVEGYDDWSMKLWIAARLMLHYVCKKYGIEVPFGHEIKDKEATSSIPMLKGLREIPKFVALRVQSKPASASPKFSKSTDVTKLKETALPFIFEFLILSSVYFIEFLDSGISTARSFARHLGLCTQCRLAVPDLRNQCSHAVMPLYEEKFICPFSIRFSQARIRPTFQDGRDVEASMDEVEAVEAPEGALKDRYDLLLRAPFPPIEIIRWWPKLREEDGETLLDENGKTVLGEPCWFTFDNRRLYCLQAAAIKNWPCRAAAVVHVMHDLPVSKCAPKKFRTTDLGCSVRISRRDDVVPKATWTWMEALEDCRNLIFDKPFMKSKVKVPLGETLPTCPVLAVCLRGFFGRLSLETRAARAARAKASKASKRPTMAEIEAKLRARKERRKLLEEQKTEPDSSESSVPEEVEDANEESEEWFDFGRAMGRVVGGAERHGQVLVRVEDSTVICQIPKGRRAPNLEPIVGDMVNVLWTSAAADAEAIVEEVLPRKTTLVRRHATAAKPQLLCANLDLAILVLSVEPNFSEGMVDRVLVSVHAQNLDVVLVLNKADLVPKGSQARHDVERRLSIYERIGYKVLFVSALEGEGVKELRELLAGRTSILVGNSGVGKSHLLNRLGEGQIAVTVGSISEKLKLGRHVTTTTTLHRLPGSGDAAYLIDSPGARRFSIWDVRPEELKEHFVEFLPYANGCKFSDCRHLEACAVRTLSSFVWLLAIRVLDCQEPACQVKEAVEEGYIPRERYMSYKRIHQLHRTAAGQIDRESADYRRSMEGIMLDENKEHWSELLDVPSDFTGGVGGELYRPKWDEDREESTVNTRTARRILKAGGCRVSRGGTEAQAAAATVAAAAVAVSLTAVADFPRFVLLVTTPKAAKASSSLARRGSKDATKPEETAKETEPAASDPWDLSKSMQGTGYSWDGALGSGYYDPESAEMYGGQDLNSMYLAAYNGAQASMAWQFQQQMMGGMLMQMQQMQMNQRLQVAKAQRARQAAVQKEKAEKAEAKAKAQAAQAAQHAREAERVRVAAEALMRLKSQNSQSQGKPSGSSLGSGSELPNIGSTLLKELNGFNSQNAPTFNSALGSLGSVGSVLSAAATAKAPVKPTATAATGDASSQSTKVGNSPSSPVSSSSLSQPSGIFEKHPPAMATAASAPSARPSTDDDDDVNCNQQ